MSREIDTFINEGFSRYKKATDVYNTFRKELQNKLQLILKTRQDWGLVVPQLESIKSTTFWPEYPLLNARITCEYKEKQLIIVIAVNWYQSETDIPFLGLWIEKGKEFWLTQDQFNWNSQFKYIDHGLRFYPNPENYGLEEHFNDLLDEFLRYIKDLEDKSEFLTTGST
ncbi:MAG: hypothetical protein COZ80_01455 [Ignavibacteria bacterium CG_4_8_14_3_um_filter_37_9]|nr:MAG: hypothetical protein COW85_06715 [Ignavibacteria bacterium CG22_combo_CG10-13_8_21_14_all_37_15]PIX00191.1 MAG: hypothetical protein COZ80_01455 [Ignavibacteria bacterium CG_4_8_14_3_um_filter_37_9]PIX94120.1 MAG: hypothetical protein COZ25_07310 [Ignavibacteria bacterium CG_4_10_14_3_um_filter_37_18]